MDRSTLLAAGFLPETNEHNQEVLVKRQPLSTLPYAYEHIADGKTYRDSMESVTTVFDNTVELRIPAADYREGPVALGTSEGLALLGDALAWVPPPAVAPRRPRP